MQLIDGIPVWGAPDPGAMVQIKNCQKTAARVALMGDHHKGYAVPIGGVVAYREHISPSGVGYDIGCGNRASMTDMTGAELRANIKTVMDDIFRIISFGIGRNNQEEVDSDLFDNPFWKLEMLAPLKQMARNQLGTVGSGNHYVDLFTDEQDRVWIGVHFGSRGLGHKTATYFLEKSGAKDSMDADPCIIPVNSYIGEDYINAMGLAGDYAYAGRDWVCERVAKILGANILDTIHNHHNFAWKEQHFGESMWVVRKGATPAYPGQRGFVGGSMGEEAVILEGVEAGEQTRLALYSTVHGAGRVMGRMEAKGKTKNGVVTRQGKVTPEMMQGWLDRGNVELRGGGLDESPDCYKRLPDVLREHQDSIKILHRLKPVGVAMAGKDVYDPFKD